MFGRGNKLSKKEEKEVESKVRVNLAIEERTKAAKEELTQQAEEEDTRGNINSSAIREMASIKYILRNNVGFVFIGVLILIAEIFIAGLLYTLGTMAVMVLALYFWLTRLYTPSYIHILLVKMKPSKTGRGSPVVYGYLHIPVSMFLHIETEGVAPSIHDLRYGPGVYMAEDVAYDEFGYPSRIKFTWMQFPELEFMLKKEMYSIMKEYLERLVIISDKQTELGKFLSIAAAREMTKERFKTIDKAKSLEYEALEDEKQAMMANISRLLKDNDNLLKGQSASYKEEEEEVEGPEEYA